MAEKIERAHKRLTEKVIDKKGVSGTSIGLEGGNPVLKVHVSAKQTAGEIPKSMDGYKVVVEHSGTFDRYSTGEA